MKNEDSFWNDLKDNWTGRVYKFLSHDGHAVIEEDLGDIIIYTVNHDKGPSICSFSLYKSVAKSRISEGHLVRVK